jgi:hypothetical protein
MIQRLIAGLTAFGALTAASAAAAHDFFLMPEKFTAEQADTVAIQATVGSSFPTPEIVVAEDRVERLFVAGPGAPTLRAAGTGDKALNLQVSGATPGLLVAGAVIKPREVDYEEDRIPLILEEYRVLPDAAAAVEALAKPRTWKVLSRRFAKTFVCAVSCENRSAAERAFGAHLEFIGHRSGNDYFQLLAHGRPLANYPVDLVDSTGKRRHLATDSAGQVHIPADARGSLMLFAAKLEPPAGQGRFILDLTSLTFSRI